MTPKYTYKDLDLGKMPPQAVELEEAVLGAILLEKNTYENNQDNRHVTAIIMMLSINKINLQPNATDNIGRAVTCPVFGLGIHFNLKK